MEAKHITFDLETLGNSTTAPIIQIGAVKFDEEGNIHDEFLRSISFNSLQKAGFHMDFETVKWWFEQDKAAIDSVILNKDRTSLTEALNEYRHWIHRPFDYEYWSHATFDAPIVFHAQKVLGLKGIIMPYKMQRDIRTLVRFSGPVGNNKPEYPERTDEFIHHNALHDARRQANYIAEAIRVIKYGKKYSYPKYMTDKLKENGSTKLVEEPVEEQE